MCPTAQDLQLMAAVWAQPRNLHPAGIGPFQFLLFCCDLGIANRIIFCIDSRHGTLLSSGHFPFIGENIDKGIGILQIVPLQQAKLLEADG